jgi:hypothetical protein
MRASKNVRHVRENRFADRINKNNKKPKHVDIGSD